MTICKTCGKPFQPWSKKATECQICGFRRIDEEKNLPEDQRDKPKNQQKVRKVNKKS